MVSGQREGLVERRELAQKTKDYRKLDEGQKKEEWKGLLKCILPSATDMPPCPCHAHATAADGAQRTRSSSIT